MVVGIGSELRGDDAAGILIANELDKKSCPKIQVLIGGTAPENLTGEIKKNNPSHLILVDCANMQENPGTIKVLHPSEIGGFSFSTHSLPLSVMIDYLKQDYLGEVMIIAVQPKSIEFGTAPSLEIKGAVHEITESIFAAAADLISP